MRGDGGAVLGPAPQDGAARLPDGGVRDAGVPDTARALDGGDQVAHRHLGDEAVVAVVLVVPVGEDVRVVPALAVRLDDHRLVAQRAGERQRDLVGTRRVDVAGERHATHPERVLGPAEVLEARLHQQVTVGDDEQLRRDARGQPEGLGVGHQSAGAVPDRDVAGQQRRLQQGGQGRAIGVHQRPRRDPVAQVHVRPGLRRCAVQDVAHRLRQLGVVGVVGVQAGPDVGEQVELEDLAVPPLQHPSTAVGADHPGHLVHGLQPVVQVVRAGLLLRDRRAVAPCPPAVDDVGQDVEGGRPQVRTRDRHLVLVAHAHREPEVDGLEELPAEHLGAGEDVGHRLRHLVEGDVAAQHLVQPARPRLLHVGLVVGLPFQGAHREVRPGADEGADVVPQRGLGEGVVRVDEGHQVAAGLGDPPVAGRPEPGVLLAHDAHAVVGRRVPRDDVHRPVGRPVVDDDHLEVAVGLAEDRGEAGVDVVLDRVDGDHDADQWLLGQWGGRGRLRSGLRAPGRLTTAPQP